MALADTLHGLLQLPGATYACVVERDSGRVLAEAGNGEAGAGDGEGVVPYSVARWGTAVAAMFDATSGDELDDVMITGRRSYHLVRSLGARASVLAYLRLDRTRANLAVARRELAAVRWGGAAGTRAAPPVRPPGSGKVDPVAREAPASRAAPDPRAATRSRDAGARTAGPRAADARSGDARTGDVRTGERRVAATQMPASLPVTGSAGRSLRSVDDAAGGPRDTAPAERAAEPVDVPRIPLPRRAPAHPPADRSRRRGGTRRAASSASASGAPEGFAMPTVLGQSWARDPSTLRRLIAGLRRMS
jgi:hypothetical protein